MVINHLKWWIAIFLSLVALYFIVPSTISFKLKEQMNRYQVEQKGREFLESNYIDLSDYNAIVLRQIDYSIISYLISAVGHNKTQQIIDNDRLPNLSWEVRFLRDVPTDQPQTRYRVRISPYGKVTGFTRELPDTLTLQSLIEAQALATARMFVSRRTDINLDNFTLKRSQQNRRINRTDYQFIWEQPAKFSDGKFELNLTVQGTEIGSYNYRFVIPESVQAVISQRATEGTFIFLIQMIGIIIIFIWGLVLFLRKYHEGEISVRMGRNLFLVFFFAGLLKSINEYPVFGSTVTIGNLSYSNVQIIMFLYEVLIQNIFLGVLLLTTWSVGEAYARSLWPDKLNSIDSLLNKRFFTQSTGTSMLRGGAIGFIIATVFLTLLYVLTGKDSNIVQIRLPFGDVFQYFVPFLSIVIGAIMMALIGEVVFRFLTINIIYQRWHKKWIAILASAMIWIVGYFIISDMPFVSSNLINILFAFGSGLLFAWLYFKYDLLTLIAASAVTYILFPSIPLLASTNTWHLLSVYLLIIAAVVPVGQIVASFFKKEHFQYNASDMPKHIRRISDRERMKKELEIARTVQMGLLPKENPEVEGFEISGLCKPAKEVGGDYFDFVQLGKFKLGIAIGDVSGKGVPAAIYMTLTKGILQSHADENISPRIVLNKVNRLLYRNIERNSFVSMFYAILDTKKYTLTYARAGHNPGIMINKSDGNSRLLSTDGIALGLEEGTIFDQTLKEHTIQLNHGDTLVFYTDGFTEAMNTRLEEYGDDTFVQLISKFRNLSANELTKKVITEIETFTSDAPQHDDMTIVAIKIL